MAKPLEWKFYRDGIYQVVRESEVRIWADQMGIYSDERGIASVLLRQCFEHIDRLRMERDHLENILKETVAVSPSARVAVHNPPV